MCRFQEAEEAEALRTSEEPDFFLSPNTSSRTKILARRRRLHTEYSCARIYARNSAKMRKMDTTSKLTMKSMLTIFGLRVLVVLIFLY